VVEDDDGVAETHDEVHVVLDEQERQPARVQLTDALLDLLAEGQAMGAIAQAVGECLSEQTGWDEDGQPLAVNFYDYHLPTAQSLPPVTSELRETPTPFTPSRVWAAIRAGVAPLPHGGR
jgi:hypothetical protein